MVLRQKYWVDREVQGILVKRVLVYAAATALYLVVGSFCFQYWDAPQRTLGEHCSLLFTQIWPWLPSALLLFPLVIHDTIRLSNLFAGPIYRLRQHLAELTVNPNCQPLKFRDDDYWQDIVQPINQLQNESIALRMVVDGLVKKQLQQQEADADRASLPTAPAPHGVDLVSGRR